MTSALAGLPRSDVASVSTYWSTPGPGAARLVSRDRRETYAVLHLAGKDDAARQQAFKAIRADLAPPELAAHGLTAQAGGTVPTEVAINSEVTANIGKAEGFSMPILLILLLVIFGGLVAASLPLAIGGAAILGSFMVLHLLTLFTTVSIYSVNITTIIGLGLGIDYGLFMVVRFREELRRQPTTEAAVARTVATAWPYHRRVRHHGRGGADQPHAVPRGVPAVDGVRRGGNRAGGHGGGAHRAARPAVPARPPGQRPPGAPVPAAGSGRPARRRRGLALRRGAAGTGSPTW